jgi:hypothetical protein
MILCALRNAFRYEGFNNLAAGLHSLIERTDINNKPQYVLQTETSYPYLQEHVQKDGDPEIEPQINAEEQNLKTAFSMINGYLTDQTRSIKGDAGRNTKKAKEGVKQYLMSVREKLLGLKVIFVNLDNEDDAYIIFETLNTRGKDLGLSDLVKGHITRLAKPKNTNVDVAKDKWVQMVRLIEESSAELNVSTFLHHYWLSAYEYLPAKKLYKSIKREVKTAQEARSFLDSLISDAPAYREINEISYRKWTKQESSIRNSLEALVQFKVKQPLPMLLSIMREYREHNLKKKHVEDILQTIEYFHFIFTAVTSQRSSGGISLMYASHARQLVAAQTLVDKLRVLSELKKKLRAKKPGYPEFLAAFQEIRFSDAYPKQKKLVQYILARIHRHNSKGMPVDYDQMTIEHLAAQNALGPAQVSDERCAEIGNLILVNHDLNEKLGNKLIQQKLTILQNSNVELERAIAKVQDWGEAEIQKRTKSLAELAYNKVWRL